MRDEPIPDDQHSPRQPIPDLRLWTMTNGMRTMRCELRHDAAGGGTFECRLFEGNLLMMNRSFPTEAGARAMADEFRADVEREGWTAI